MENKSCWVLRVWWGRSPQCCHCSCLACWSKITGCALQCRSDHSFKGGMMMFVVASHAKLTTTLKWRHSPASTVFILGAATWIGILRKVNTSIHFFYWASWICSFEHLMELHQSEHKKKKLIQSASLKIFNNFVIISNTIKTNNKGLQKSIVIPTNESPRTEPITGDAPLNQSGCWTLIALSLWQ